MKIKYFTESCYNDLFDTIDRNKDKYAIHTDGKWVAEFFGDKVYCKESRIDVSLPSLDVSLGEYANCIAIHNAFRDRITPKQASNPYLWSYLTHCEYWEYTSRRWSKEEMSVDTIKQRFFCGPEEGNRIGLLRNAISRLWWAGYLSYQEDKPAAPYELTQLLFSHSDICQSVIERNYSMNKNITIGILRAIKMINDDPKLKDVGISEKTSEYEWRDLCKYLNRFGAVTLLDTLSKDDICEMSYDYILKQRK